MGRLTALVAMLTLAGMMTASAQDAGKGKTGDEKGDGPKKEKVIPDDGFLEGAQFSGTLVHYSLDAKKKLVAKGNPISVLVTKRSGKDFSATVPGAYEVEGTIQPSGVVKWKVTKSLAEHTKGQVGVKTFLGTCRFNKEKDEWVLKGESMVAAEQYAGKWELKSKKEK